MLRYISIYCNPPDKMYKIHTTINVLTLTLKLYIHQPSVDSPQRYAPNFQFYYPETTVLSIDQHKFLSIESTSITQLRCNSTCHRMFAREPPRGRIVALSAPVIQHEINDNVTMFCHLKHICRVPGTMLHVVLRSW